MQFLIHLPIQSTLAEAIQNLSDARLYAIFGPVILQRSYDYIDEVEDIDYAPGYAQTLIYGTEEYEVEIKHELSTERLYGDCTCPYDGGACKHIAAFLQYLREADDLGEINYPASKMHNIPAHEIVNAPATFDFKTWVQSRSREELEHLVLQHAPESLRKSLALQAGSTSVQEELFQKVEKKIKKILTELDEYDADDFEETLLKYLEDLRPLWTLLPEKIVKLLQKIIKATDKAQDEGYLYDHYGDGGFEGYRLGTYLAEFFASLPAEFFGTGIEEMLEVFGDLSYSICDNFITELLPKLDHSKGVVLKNLLLRSDLLLQQTPHQQKDIWAFLKPFLSAPEQKQLLVSLSDPFFMLELIELYEQEGQYQEAIRLLKQRIPQAQKSTWGDFYQVATGTEALYEKLIELLSKEKQAEELTKWVHRYVDERANARSLSFSIQFLPEAQTELEVLLKKRRIVNFAQYLEESFRAPEALELFKSYPKDFPQSIQYDFFKRNHLLFPKEAQVVFKQALDEALPIAKDYSYRAVVEALVLLRELMEKQAFVALVQSIRGAYKRRSNLLGLMQSAGLHFPGK